MDAPSPLQVARRALCLAALVCRGQTDQDHPEAQDLHRRLREWIRALDLRFEERESRILEARAGELSPADRRFATWRVEGLTVLVWALFLGPFPQHDRWAEAFDLTDRLFLLSDQARDLVKDARLRPAEDLAAAREFFYALHCALHQYQREPEALDLQSWFERDWLLRLELEPILGPEGQLMIEGLSIDQAPEEGRVFLEGVVRERHRAAIWLVGEEGPGYSDFTVDT